MLFRSEPAEDQRVSGEELQTAISALQQTVSGLSTSSFLPRVGPASFTGNLQVESLKITNALLTPYLLAPAANIDLNIRNYKNLGGLSISNATGQVHVPYGLTTGMAAIWEGNIPARHLRFEHDIGMNFRCGAAYVLSLEERRSKAL